MGVVVTANVVGGVECTCVGCTVVTAGSKIGGCAVVELDAVTGAGAGFAVASGTIVLNVVAGVVGGCPLVFGLCPKKRFTFSVNSMNPKNKNLDFLL